MGYNYGIAGPFWFAAGCAFQIALMAVLGVLAKLRVPYAHTSLEIIQMRYGVWGHIVFAILNIINNVCRFSEHFISFPVDTLEC